MKLKYLLSIIFIVSLTLPSISQNNIYNKAKVVNSKDSKQKPTSDLITVKVDKEDDSSYKIQLRKDTLQSEFLIKPLRYESFKTGFERSFEAISSNKIDSSTQELNILFMDILLNTMDEEDAPLAGTISFKKNVLVGMEVEFEKKIGNGASDTISLIFSIDEWIKQKKKLEKRNRIDSEKVLKNALELPIKKTETLRIKKRKRGDEEEKKVTIGILNKTHLNFIPTKTQIEFNNGYIENIVFEGQIGSELVVFENTIPIGFSTGADFNNLENEYLVARYKFEEYNYLLKVPVSNFISYKRNLRINTRDYCPKNDVISIPLPTPPVKIYKEENSKILEAKIFTDLKGLKEGEPNGVIQTEIEKKINLRTKRHKFLWGSNFGFLQYVKPYAILNKIEEKNRYVELNKKMVGELSTNFLELYQYEAFRTGVETNAFVFDAPFGKSNIWINGGIAFGKVTGSDTTQNQTAQVNKYTINTLHLYGKILFNVIPDKRYGASFSYQIGHYDALSSEITYLPVDGTGSNEHWLQNIELFAYWNISKTGKLFFRYRLNSPWDNWKYNFAQTQIGYSFDISKQIKSK